MAKLKKASKKKKTRKKKQRAEAHRYSPSPPRNPQPSGESGRTGAETPKQNGEVTKELIRMVILLGALILGVLVILLRPEAAASCAALVEKVIRAAAVSI